jgi:hypothetical protein
MLTIIERFVYGLSASERMSALVGVLVIVGMLSAISVDRLLDRFGSPMIVAVDAPGERPAQQATVDAYREINR